MIPSHKNLNFMMDMIILPVLERMYILQPMVELKNQNIGVPLVIILKSIMVMGI